MIVSSIYGDPYVVINWLIWTRVGTRLIRETLAATLASVKNVSEHNDRDPIYGDNPSSLFFFSIYVVGFVEVSIVIFIDGDSGDDSQLHIWRSICCNKLANLDTRRHASHP